VSTVSRRTKTSEELEWPEWLVELAARDSPPAELTEERTLSL